MLTTHAPAKINLTLAVHGRRPDGRHDLTSLVAFAGVGDRLTLDPGRPLGLNITGPFAGDLSADAGNLVLEAVGNLAGVAGLPRAGHFSLVKRLPVASGIGGGSADAAAALRLVARLNGWPLDRPELMEAARRTGADVPVCLMSKARAMSGVGDQLGPPLDLPELFAVLANPGVAVSTASVFAALGLQKGEARRHDPGPGTNAGSWSKDGLGDAASLISADLEDHGNDLEGAACLMQPVIGVALAALGRAKGCRLARMSGSGATCFGLFGGRAESLAAAKALQTSNPEWWVRATILR